MSVDNVNQSKKSAGLANTLELDVSADALAIKSTSLRQANISRVYFAVSLILLVCWIFANILKGEAFTKDGLEQFNWSHGFEWGYYKHPPLTTLLLIGLNQLIGFHTYNTIILDLIVLSLTLFFVWRSSVELLGDGWGGLSVLLFSGNFLFTDRATLYNHTCVMAMAVSACTYTTLYAVRHAKNKPFAWSLNGFVVALAILSKYQALVSIVGILFALVFSGAFKDKAVRKGMLISLGVCALALLPHLWWLWRTNFLIFDYTSNLGRGQSGLILRVHWFVSYFFCQLNAYWITLASIALSLFAGIITFVPHGLSWPNFRSATKSSEFYWIIGLLGVPLAFCFVVDIFGGVRLLRYWGGPFFIFFPAFICFFFKYLAATINPKRFLIVFIGFNILAVTIFVASPFKMSNQRSVNIAREGVALWRSKTNAPLKFILAPDQETGDRISVYSGLFVPVTRGDNAKFPWVSNADLQKYGHLDVSRACRKCDPDLSVTLPETE